jgi:TATA-binding protein-associated factor Taf7
VLAAEQQTMEHEQGDKDAHVEDLGIQDSSSDDNSDSESKTLEGAELQPSAMDLLRRTGMAVREPSRSPTGLQLTSKRVSKELRVCLNILDSWLLQQVSS